MKNIFILDINSILSNIIKKELETSKSYRVSCFNNQSDFLVALENKPDIILIDPDINKENDAFLNFYKGITSMLPNVSIILFSNLSNIKLGIELIRKGAVNYINKKDDSFLQEIKKTIGVIAKIDENNKELQYINQKLTSLKKKVFIYILTSIALLLFFFFL